MGNASGLSRYTETMKCVLLLPCVVWCFAAVLPAHAVDYKTEILPLMKRYCWDCHSNETEVKGNLALDDLEEVRLYQIGKYNIIRPGNAAESNFLERLKLPAGHNDFMPRRGDPLPEDEIDLIERWIERGAVVDAENPSEEESAWLERTGGESAEASAEWIEWISRDGKSIEARFRGIEGEAVQLVTKEGKAYTVPFNRLSPESVGRARRLGGVEASTGGE